MNSLSRLGLTSAKHPAISSDGDVREYFREKVAHLRHSKRYNRARLAERRASQLSGHNRRLEDVDVEMARSEKEVDSKKATTKCAPDVEGTMG